MHFIMEMKGLELKSESLGSNSDSAPNSYKPHKDVTMIKRDNIECI